MEATSADRARKRASRADAEAQLARWTELAKAGSNLDPALYPEYDVKRGLRDVSGKGVLAGLTQIGDVVGSAPEGDVLVPAPGQLIYRGIGIEKLVEGFVAEKRFGYEETCYLLLFGELPTKDELSEFEARLATNRTLPRNFVLNAILGVPSRDVMNAMARGVLSLYTLDKNPDDTSITNMLRQSLHLISKFAMLAVYAYQAYLDEYCGRSL